MIYITGDVHADLKRFADKRLKKLKKSDSLIICGDLGLIWDGSKKEKRILKRLGRRKYNILFVEGAHENFDELDKYDTDEWCGGLTRVISGNLRQLMRGYVFEISGKRVFAFGGGAGEANGGSPPCSEEARIRHEIPEARELEESDKRLKEYPDGVDYVVSYEPPKTIAEFLVSGIDAADTVSVYLEKKKETLKFTHWFFGKHHVTKIVPPRFMCVFDSVIDAKDMK